jgi:hypothetical protein
MTVTNHVLSGALIGSLLPLPLAIPVAFASHFVLDALPHYGIKQKKRNRSRSYRSILLGDSLLGIGLSLSMLVMHQWTLFIPALAAYSPDIMWIFYYLRQGHDLYLRPTNRFFKFHQSIQRYERPWGIYIELVLALIMLPFFIMQVVK